MSTTDDYITKQSGGEHPVGIYLPNSDSSKVICEAYVDNFDDSKGYWGYGISPIRYTSIKHNSEPNMDLSSPVYQYRRYDENNNAIWLGTGTAGNAVRFISSCYLGSYASAFTTYFVVKVAETNPSSSTLLTLLGVSYPNSIQIGFDTNKTTMKLCSWNGITANYITLFTSSDWLVIAFKHNGNPASNSGVYSYGVMSKDVSTLTSANWKVDSSNLKTLVKGNQISLGYYDPSLPTSLNMDNRFWTDLYVRYFAVLPVEETFEVITANMSYLLTTFL